MSSSSSSPIGSGRSRSSTNQSQWTSSSLEPEGYTNFSSTGFSSSPPSFTSTHPNVNFGNRSTVNSNWNPSPLSNQNQNQPTKTANPLRPDFQSRPRTSTFNSAPPTSSIPQTTQFDLNKPKIILSFEITQISISVSCIRIDSKLPVLFTESIIFDQEFPEYKTQNGSYRSEAPSREGVSSLTPIEMVVKGIDRLLERLKDGNKLNLKQVVAIACSGATHIPVLLSKDASKILGSLSPHLPLSSQLSYPQFYTIPFIPNQDDCSAEAELRMIEAGFEQKVQAVQEETSPSHLNSSSFRSLRQEAKEKASKTLGISPSLSGIPSQLAKIKAGLAVGFVGDEGTVSNAWNRTGYIQTIGTMMYSIFIGKIGGMNTTEATATGMFNPIENRWEQEILQTINPGKGRDLEEMLGKVNTYRNEKVGSWLSQRFGLDPDCIVATSLPLNAAIYLSFLPQPTDAIISFGSSNDTLLTSSHHYLPSSSYSVLPHPLSKFFGSSAANWIIDYQAIEAAKARIIARDSFCNGRWNVLSHMVAITPSGGSIGMDNKMFTIVVPRGERKGIRRFEHGVRVAEFSDIRVNARCLIEGQALSLRAALGRIAALDGRQPESQAYPGSGARLGFNPFYEGLAPARIFTVGKASGNEALSKVYSDVLGGDFIASLEEFEKVRKDQDKESLKHLSISPVSMNDSRSRSSSIASGSIAAKDLGFNPVEKLGDQVSERFNEKIGASKATIGAAWFALCNYERENGVSGSTFEETVGSYLKGTHQERLGTQSQIQSKASVNRRSVSDSGTQSFYGHQERTFDRWSGEQQIEDDLTTPRPPLKDLEPESISVYREEEEEEEDYHAYENRGLVGAASVTSLSNSNPNIRKNPRLKPILRRQRSSTMGCQGSDDWRSRTSSGSSNHESTRAVEFSGHLSTDYETIQSHVESLEEMLNQADLLSSNLEYLNENQRGEVVEVETDMERRIGEREEKREVKRQMEETKKDQLSLLGLIRMASSDDDAYSIYGGLLEEHVRLMESIDRIED